jgi:hypothetical protein
LKHSIHEADITLDNILFSMVKTAFFNSNNHYQIDNTIKLSDIWHFKTHRKGLASKQPNLCMNTFFEFSHGFISDKSHKKQLYLLKTYVPLI